MTTPASPSSSPSVSRDDGFAAGSFGSFAHRRWSNLLGHGCRGNSFGPVCNAAKRDNSCLANRSRFVLKHAPCRFGIASASWSRARLRRRRRASTSSKPCARFSPATRNCAAVAFSVAMIALSAKMAKADGIVTQDEVRAFQQIFEVPAEEARNVARLYDLAKQDIAGFEAYAERMAELCGSGHANCAMLEDILDGLFHIAKADGVLHEREGDFLHRIAEIFRIEEEHYQQHPGAPRQSRRCRSLADPRHRARQAVRGGAAALSQARRRQSSRPADRARRARGVHQDRHRPGSPRSTPPMR